MGPAFLARWPPSCALGAPVADFCPALLGLEAVASAGENCAMLKGETGPALGFGKVPDYQPPAWPNEGGTKQFHLDIAVPDIAAAEKQALLQASA